MKKLKEVGYWGLIVTVLAMAFLVLVPFVANAQDANGALRKKTTAAAGSLVLKTSAGYLDDCEVTAGASAGYLMIIDTNAVPADGTVTPTFSKAVPANDSRTIAPPRATRFKDGIVAVFSTTGPYTKTISATAFISCGVR